MGRVGATVRAPTLRSFGQSLVTLGLTALLAAILALGVVTATGGAVRFLFACAFVFALMMLALTRASAAVLAVLVFLIFVAFIRRLLIAAAPWQAGDPLLLVAPLVAGLLLVKLFVLERRPIARDGLSWVVLALLVLTVGQAVNPASGIAAGLTGLLFMAVPLTWFFVGREVVTDRVAESLFAIVVVLGTAVGVYGVLQTELGRPWWDRQWLQVASGYHSLNVGDVVRAFGTFSSFTEYATFTAVALVLAIWFVMRGRTVALLPVPFLAVALFLSSSRTPLLTSVLAIVVMFALRPRRPRLALTVVLVACAAAAAVVVVFGSALSDASSGSALVSHQVGGFADPLNPNNSTLLLHLDEVVQAVKLSLHHPIGFGTGATNMASGVGGADNLVSTDIDISNEFVALGPLGGILYLGLIGFAMTLVVRAYFAGRAFALPVLGVLIVVFGQWLNGGFYALAPLTWLLLGWVAAAGMGIGRR